MIFINRFHIVFKLISVFLLISFLFSAIWGGNKIAYAQDIPLSTSTPTPTPNPVYPNDNSGENSDIVPQIVGGKPAIQGQFPWQVLILVNGERHCGGVLIDPKWVLTAAHCVKVGNYTISNTSVLLGELDTSPSRIEGLKKRMLKDVIVHEHYNHKDPTSDNDVALLELSKPVMLTRYIQPIPLVSSPANDALVAPGKWGRVSGWGYDNEFSQTRPSILQWTDLTIVPDVNCINDKNGTMCAGEKKNSTPSGCQKDSGSPFVVEDVKDGSNWRLAGIVKAAGVSKNLLGLECFQPNLFTRISVYTADWIYKIIHNPDLKGSFQLIPASSTNEKQCLDVGGSAPASTANGVLIQTESCKSTVQTREQLWKLTQVGNYFQIRSVNSNKCLNVIGGVAARADGTKTEQWDCLGANQTNQLWKLVPFGNYYQLRAVHSNKCLDVSGGGDPVTGTAIIQYTCNASGATNQLWQILPVGDFQFTAKHSGRCLDVTGWSLVDRTRVQQWDCGGSSQINQMWRPVPVLDSNNMFTGWYQLVASHSGKCLDVTGGPSATANGAIIQQLPCNGLDQTNQHWRFNPLNGTFQLIAKHSRKCLNVIGGRYATANGKNIEQWDCLGASQTNQLWQFRLP